MQYTILDKSIKTEVSHWWHIKVEGEFYIVSASFPANEVMVFPTNAECEWLSSDDVAVVTHTLDHKEGIAALIQALSEREDDEEEEEETSISERDALERFDEYLNEVNGLVSICGYHYDAARSLKMVDEVAYREEFNNWLDSEGLELE
jgi:hypothetical protein